jgi:hypothetical protein
VTELPKTVLHRLAALPPAEHPAADLLAALVERQLSSPERKAMLAHLAVCPDCREIVWHSLPEEEAALAVAPGSAARKLWVPVWRWAGLAAAVVVIAVVAVVYRGGPGPAGQQMAKVAPAAPAPARQTAQLDDQPARLQAQNEAPKPSPPAAERRDSMKALAKSEVALPAASGPVPASAKDAGVTIASAATNLAMGKKKLAPPTLWMLSSYGRLLRSTDSGKNWQAVPFAGNPVFRAVAVVGPKVWVGGVGGALYYSSDDGSQWTRLAPSGGVHLNEDIRALIFQDSRHGNLTTASGQSWTSSDGGHSWQKQ